MIGLPCAPFPPLLPLTITAHSGSCWKSRAVFPFNIGVAEQPSPNHNHEEFTSYFPPHDAQRTRRLHGVAAPRNDASVAGLGGGSTAAHSHGDSIHGQRRA